MYLERPDLIKLISKDTGITLHQTENVLNAAFGHLKKLLSQEAIDRVADDLEAEDLRAVWLTAELAEKEALQLTEQESAEVKRWH